MPYRLQKDESLGGGLKRIAEEQVTGAINQLQAGNIYEVRKYIKKTRAILALLKPYLGPRSSEENRRLRDIARDFSVWRDMDVSLELLEKFAQEYKRKSTLNPQRKELSEKRSAQKRDVQATEYAERLAATRKRIEDWHLQQLTPAFIESQIQKTHKRSGQAYKAAAESRTPEEFHEFRKSVKRELNQRRLVNSPEAQIRILKELSDVLGDHHNLAVLMATLDRTSRRFRLRMERQLRDFEGRILAIAEALYEGKHQRAAA